MPHVRLSASSIRLLVVLLLAGSMGSFVLGQEVGRARLSHQAQSSLQPGAGHHAPVSVSSGRLGAAPPAPRPPRGSSDSQPVTLHVSSRPPHAAVPAPPVSAPHASLAPAASTDNGNSGKHKGHGKDHRGTQAHKDLQGKHGKKDPTGNGDPPHDNAGSVQPVPPAQPAQPQPQPNQSKPDVQSST